MIDDLIDLYYYIRSTEELKHLEGWSFEDTNNCHSVSLISNWDTGNWEFKITVGNVNDYRQIFLSKNEVEIHKSGTYRYSIAVPAMINENVSDLLMNFLDSDEIIIMNYIYLEMYKLKNRSRPYERSNP